MRHDVLWVRAGGALLMALGISLIILSGEIFTLVRLEMPERTSETVLRAGFSISLIGLFALFLFSERSLPQGLVVAFSSTQDENLANLLVSLNLKGSGTYLPPGGRLTQDRVFVPVEDRSMPLPHPSDGSFLNTGDLGPSIGIFLVPPGKDAVDHVEMSTGKRFLDDDPIDANESVERLTKGTGLLKDVSVRKKGERIDLVIVHSRMNTVCDAAWREHPDHHRAVGCSGCSTVLTALARVQKSPIRIVSASRDGNKVRYELRLVVD